MTDFGGPSWFWVGGWVGGWGWGWWEGAPHTCAHACTCTHMHTCARIDTRVWHHREFPGISPMGAAICIISCLTCVHVCVCTCVHPHACACVWGAPPTTPHPHPSTSPTPRAAGSPKHQNSISLELIEIIRFCLKILYLWTFLNSYRL